MTDLVDYLTSQAGFTAGTDLFYSQMPDPGSGVAELATALYETGGRSYAHGMASAPGAAVAEYPHVQVVTRGARDGYDEARAVQQRVWSLLDGSIGRTINGVQYDWGMALQPPFALGRDEQHRPLIACNYEFAKAVSTSTST